MSVTPTEQFAKRLERVRDVFQENIEDGRVFTLVNANHYSGRCSHVVLCFNDAVQNRLIRPTFSYANNSERLQLLTAAVECFFSKVSKESDKNPVIEKYGLDTDLPAHENAEKIAAYLDASIKKWQQGQHERSRAVVVGGISRGYGADRRSFAERLKERLSEDIIRHEL